jgi:phage shock protein PspC (stress-responsive transcriptional regulator)
VEGELDDKAGTLAAVALTLLEHQPDWRHRRVDTITVLSHEQVRRNVSVDFTVPAELRESLRISSAGEHIVPLALLARRPLVHFDLRNEEGHSVPLLTAQQSALIDREMLELALASDLDRLGVEDTTAQAIDLSAGAVIEAVLAGENVAGAVERIEDDFALEPLLDFRKTVGDLGEGFLVWAVSRELERRRVFKFAYDEMFALRADFGHRYTASGAVEAASYHVEVAVPPDLRARRTRLVDDATRRVLAEGARDTDRAALYYAQTDDPPQDPGVVVDFGVERARFLVPAAIVATVITLLLGLPALLSDLETLAGSAGPAIGIVLSTSAVFSALVLRTDEHPLLRLMLVRRRLALVACTLAALLAGAALGFQADPVLLRIVWVVAALVSAAATAILIIAAVHSPSASSAPPPA